MNLSLPTDRDERKKTPLFGGSFGYFAAALVGVARHSYRNNELHNKGQPMHWSVDKSNDHAECVQRHLLDLQEMLSHIERVHESGQQFAENAPQIPALLEEADALAWRALALNQTLRMKYAGAPLPVNAKRDEFVDIEHVVENPRGSASLAAAAEAEFSFAGYPSPRCSNCMQQTCVCDAWRAPRVVPEKITRVRKDTVHDCCYDSTCNACYRDATGYDDLPIG